jgi:uncharacterized protein YdiU (UPF0061 family)
VLKISLLAAGFLNQPVAGHRNFTSFAAALLPLMDADGKKEAQAIVTDYTAVAMGKMNTMWCEKLGLSQWDGSVKTLMEELKGPTERRDGLFCTENIPTDGMLLY